VIRAARDFFRLVGIAAILARHDALPREGLRVGPAFTFLWRLVAKRGVEGRDGQRLARALTDLGPTFIKLGQLLSTRPDLMGERAAEDLSELRDRLPPFPGGAARAIVEESLGKPIGALFRSFDDEAIAAASIAQVHFAVTTEGEEVAVKVLRPSVEAEFERDIALFRRLAHWGVRLVPAMRRLRPMEVVDTFARTVRVEMDLRMEAAAASEFAENFANDDVCRVPRLDWTRTARRVLTLERVKGYKLDDAAGLRRAGIDVDAVLAKASAALFNQVFRDGFFHADLHPGNMFVGENGDLIIIDFGIMGRIDRDTRNYLADMLIGFLTGDYRRVAEVHFRAGYVPPHQSLDLFTQACRAIGEPLRDRPLNEISVGRLLAQLLATTERFEMEVQPQLLLLQKSMLTAEGVGRTLNPDVNMWELARPLIEAWMRENRGPEAMLIDDLRAGLHAVRRLPALIVEAERAVRQFADDGLRLHPEGARAFTDRVRKGGTLRYALWAIAFLLAAILIRMP